MYNAGCHFDCPKCSSPKCGIFCRKYQHGRISSIETGCDANGEKRMIHNPLIRKRKHSNDN